MTQSIHLTDAKGRDATVGYVRLKSPPKPHLGLPGQTVSFRRFVAAAETGTHAALQQRYGADYGSALIEGDPEVDIEQVGQFIEQTQSVYLDGDGKVLYVEPGTIEVLAAPDGTEKERRAPVDVDANVDEAQPLRWTGRKIPVADAVRRFAFKRRLQLVHTDGLTFEFLHSMATELERSASLMLLGSGDKGAGPLVFLANGRPYRGFLHGKTEGRSYALVLLLSDMELKPPADRAGSAGGQ